MTTYTGHERDWWLDDNPGKTVADFERIFAKANAMPDPSLSEAKAAIGIPPARQRQAQADHRAGQRCESCGKAAQGRAAGRGASMNELEITAHHEAAHAVAARIVGLPIEHVTIEQDGFGFYKMDHSGTQNLSDKQLCEHVSAYLVYYSLARLLNGA